MTSPEIDFSDTAYWGEWSEVGPGWHAIVLDLDQRLREVAPKFQWVRIKEKFGELRGHVDIRTLPSGVLDQVRELVWEARRRSAKTCENCGQPGSLRKERGPFRTRCDQCEKEEAG